MASSIFQVDQIYHTEDCELEISDRFEASIITEKELGRISGLKSPNQLLATVHYASSKQRKASEGHILLLDDVKDPGNLGTIIRTADWFGVQQVICSPNSVDRYNPKVVQASMGSIFRMPLYYDQLDQKIDSLKIAGYSIFGADMHGENAFEIDYPQKTALIMGSESHGLSDLIRSMTQTITIPKKGKAESLNVAMATGILLAKITN